MDYFNVVSYSCCTVFIIHEYVIVCSLPAMVGDVNLYMNDLDNPQLAEVEIMIAEPQRYLLFSSLIMDKSVEKFFFAAMLIQSCLFISDLVPVH